MAVSDKSSINWELFLTSLVSPARYLSEKYKTPGAK